MESIPPNASTTAQPTSAKRKRVNDENLVQPANTPERYKDMCFDDASVVLRCPTAVFRVHRGILSTHSQVFRDMFTLGHGIELEPGTAIPVVQVQDPDEKMYRFLKYLYVPELPSKVEIGLSFDVLLDILELSLKYMAKVVRDNCLEIIRYFYPHTLEEYIASDKHRDDIAFEDTLRCIELAEVHGLLSILPSLYTSLMGYAPMNFPDEHAEDYLLPHTLSRHLATLVVAGTRQLQLLKRDTIGAYIHKFVDSPTIEKFHCSEAMARIFLRHLIKVDMHGIDPLDVWVIFREPEEAVDSTAGAATSLCGPCRKKWRNAEIAGRKKAWQELPRCYNLATWVELRAQEKLRLEA